MSRGTIERREDRLLTLLADPLTRTILLILAGVDPGRVSEEVLIEIIDDKRSGSSETPVARRLDRKSRVSVNSASATARTMGGEINRLL